MSKHTVTLIEPKKCIGLIECMIFFVFKTGTLFPKALSKMFIEYPYNIMEHLNVHVVVLECTMTESFLVGLNLSVLF